MDTKDIMLVEELESRLELASFAAEEAADSGCCSGSCCIVGGNCQPAPAPAPA